MATTKWAYHKEWSFASNCLFFWKICFSFRISWKELIWYINDPDVHIRIFCNRRSLILGCFFPLSILNLDYLIQGTRSSPSEVFLGKGVLKICSKFTGEHSCRSAISIKLLFGKQGNCEHQTTIRREKVWQTIVAREVF